MQKLRAGLIGYGNWAREAYLPALRLDGRVLIGAAAAPSEATRRRIRSDLGNDVRVYEGFEPLLQDSELDLVLISLPGNRHEEALLAAIEAGIPFLYEPPVSDRLDRIVPTLNRLLTTGQVTHADLEVRYAPVLRRAAQCISEGAIGEPLTAEIRMNGTWSPQRDSRISLPHALSGWYIDPLDFVLGTSARRVLVQNGHGNPGRMQAYALTQLDYGGVWGTFRCNISSVRGPDTVLEVNGRDGDLKADLLAEELRIRNRRKPDWTLEAVPALRPWSGWPGMHECLRAFLDAVEGKSQNHMHPVIMAQAHLIGLAAEESIDTGTWAAVRGVQENEYHFGRAWQRPIRPPRS